MILLRSLLRFFQIIYCLYAYSLFAVVITVVLFPCLLICLPLGRIRGGNIMFDLYRFLGKIWFLLIGIRHINIYKSSPAADEQYIFVANHISYLDAVAIILSINHHFRAIGKYELLKVPIFGFLYRFCVVTVNRSSAEDRARSLADLRKILAKNISIAVFPEGTFNMADAPLKEMYDGAFKLAVETGKRIQPILFLDTYDRLHYDSIFSLRPGRSRAVFLDPIDPSVFPQADPRELKRITAEKMASALIAYKATWISEFYLENKNHG